MKQVWGKHTSAIRASGCNVSLESELSNRLELSYSPSIAVSESAMSEGSKCSREEDGNVIPCDVCKVGVGDTTTTFIRKTVKQSIQSTLARSPFSGHMDQVGARARLPLAARGSGPGTSKIAFRAAMTTPLNYGTVDWKG